MNRIEINKVAHLTGHRNPVYAIETGIGENAFYTAGNDKGVVGWDLERMSVQQVLCPVAHTVYALHRLSGTELALAAMRDGTVLLLDIGEDREKGNDGSNKDRILARIRNHQKPVFAVGSFADPEGADTADNRIVIASEDGTATVWTVGERGDGLTGSAGTIVVIMKQQVTISDSPIRCLSISPDGKTIAFGDKNGQVKMYRTSDFSLQKVLDAHSTSLTALRFSPDGIYLLTAGRDAELHIYHTDDYRQEKTFVPHLFAVYSIRYHPYLPVFATGSQDKSIKIWSSDDFRLLRIISVEKGMDAHRLSVNALTWSVNGRYLLSTGDDKVVMVWEVKESTNDIHS